MDPDQEQLRWRHPGPSFQPELKAQGRTDRDVRSAFSPEVNYTQAQMVSEIADELGCLIFEFDSVKERTNRAQGLRSLREFDSISKGAPTSEEKLMPKNNCTVSEVTIMNLQPEKNPILILPGGKSGSERRNLGLHPPSPRISEKRPGQGEKKLWPEKVKKEGALSPSLRHANELCSTENIILKRPVKLAPLEIPLEVKEAQLQKIMVIRREAQMAAQKLTVTSSISNEPHVKKVKNLAQGELESLQKIKVSEKATLENKDDHLSLKSSKPLGEIQIISPPETSSKLTKQLGPEDAPKAVRKQLIPALQAPDIHEDSNSPDSSLDPCQNDSRRRFRLRHMKEQKEDHGRDKPLKVTDPIVGESKQKNAGQRTQKTLNDANKLIEDVAKKHKELGAQQGVINEASFVRRQSIRRMALGDIIQVDED